MNEYINIKATTSNTMNFFFIFLSLDELLRFMQFSRATRLLQCHSLIMTNAKQYLNILHFKSLLYALSNLNSTKILILIYFGHKPVDSEYDDIISIKLTVILIFWSS